MISYINIMLAEQGKRKELREKNGTKGTECRLDLRGAEYNTEGYRRD